MNRQKNRKGKVVVVSGPSGVGKSTICRAVIKRLKNTCISVSVTTRPKAETEVNGRDYWFVSKEQFRQQIDNALLLEHAEVFGNFYGTPKDKVTEAIESGKTIILEIDVQGAKQIKAMLPDAVMIFILPPTKKDLSKRLNGRGREDSKTAQKRLSGADAEIAAAKQYYEHTVVNEDLEQAINKVIQIIEET